MNNYPPNNEYGQAPEVHFKNDWSNSHINNHGIRVRIERALICPNYVGNVDSYHHDPSCELCDAGFIHFDPLECWVVFQQNDLVKAFLREGLYDPGRAIITVPHVTGDGTPIMLSHFDRVTLLDEEERFNEVLNKSEGRIDWLRYKAVSVLHLRDRRGTTYINNTHFKLDADGNIEWLDGQDRPQHNLNEGMGETFSVGYTFRPTYRVMDILHEGRFSNTLANGRREITRHPQLVLIKKDYYITKKDIDGSPIYPNKSSQKLIYDHQNQINDY